MQACVCRCMCADAGLYLTQALSALLYMHPKPSHNGMCTVGSCGSHAPLLPLHAPMQRIHSSQDKPLSASDRHACTQAVLVNGGSASTSEAVAAALRDSGGAVLVGEPTFGKAKMQRAVPLHGGATLLLSNTVFLSPKHAVIDKVKEYL